MLGEKTILIIQTNFIKIAVKDEKTSKRQKSPLTLRLPSLSLYSKSGGKTVNAASSQPIFKPKSQISPSQGWFLWRGGRNGIHWRLIPGLSMAPKASKWSASLSIRRIRLWWTFFCFREAKSKPAGLSLSQGGPMKNVEGVAWISCKNKSTAAVRQYKDRCKWYVRIGIKQALKRPEIAELLKWFVLKLFRLAHSILNTPRTYTLLSFYFLLILFKFSIYNKN
jgi:hypothetical protein